MVGPYGFGVGDFVAVGTLAWNVYKSCRAAPGSFSNISIEVLSLHAVLKEADETIFKSPLPPQSQARLKTIGDGCQCVLGDLQALVEKYENLRTQSKRTWDRMKWGAEDIAEIRSRLISSTTMLTAFIRWAPFLFEYLNLLLMQLPFSTSQTSVEQKLDKLIRDFQQGKRTPSVVSLQTVESLDPDDKEAWRTIRKELEDIGITVAAFDANKDFIFEWFSNAVDTGAFQEQTVSSVPASVYSLDVPPSTSCLSSLEVKESDKKTVMGDRDPAKESGAETKATENYTIVQAEQGSNGTGPAVKPHARVSTKVPRVAALIAFLSRPRGRLIDAAQIGDLNGIKKILTNPATSRLIDKPALNDALYWAIQATSKEACALLIDAGAGINDPPHNSHFNDKRPLTKAVRHGNSDLIAFFLDNGADVNYQNGDGGKHSSALRIAIARDDEAMITFFSQRGADINAVQKGARSQWNYPVDFYPTGIHQASAISSAGIVDLLIKLGANFNLSRREFGTPLMLSICRGCFWNAELLIQKGANINEIAEFLEVHGRRFHSAILIAIYVSSPDMVKLLLNSGVVTDWHEEYELAVQCASSRSMKTPWQDGRTVQERSSDAHVILELIRKQYKRSVQTYYTSAAKSTRALDAAVSNLGPIAIPRKRYSLQRRGVSGFG